MLMSIQTRNYVNLLRPWNSAAPYYLETADRFLAATESTATMLAGQPEAGPGSFYPKRNFRECGDSQSQMGWRSFFYSIFRCKAESILPASFMQAATSNGSSVKGSLVDLRDLGATEGFSPGGAWKENIRKQSARPSIEGEH
jgi:hypothetical protein